MRISRISWFCESAMRPPSVNFVVVWTRAPAAAPQPNARLRKRRSRRARFTSPLVSGAAFLPA